MNLQEQEDKFLSVLQDHKQLIFKICWSYCKEYDDRKDLEQDIVIQLWNAFPKYNPEYKLSTWIYRISLNTAISHFRKESRRDSEKYLFDEEIAEFTPDDIDENKDENIRLLNQFIDGLGKLDKALMILYLDENSYKEISEILGITETNVATKISRMKLSIKKYFSDMENK